MAGKYEGEQENGMDHDFHSICKTVTKLMLPLTIIAQKWSERGVVWKKYLFWKKYCFLCSTMTEKLVVLGKCFIQLL